MIIKIRIGPIRVTLTVARVLDVVGVNSLLPDGQHILMWDFDSVPLEEVEKILADVQDDFNLPNVYILVTSPGDHYIAYCFHRRDWSNARAIIGYTPGIDENFFKWGVFRRRFTLRVGPKLGIIPRIVRILLSPYPETADITELRSWVKYETLPRQWRGRFIILGEEHRGR